MDQHHRVARPEALRFDHRGGSPVNQLVANVIGYGVTKPEHFREIGETSPFSARRAHLPFAHGSVEWLVDLPLDSDRDQIRLALCQHPDVILRGTRSAG